MERRGRFWVFVAAFIYALVVVVATWPLVTALGDFLPGSSTDSYMHFWNGWWVNKALQMGSSPYYSTLIFFPEGASLIAHNLAWLSIVPWIVVQRFFAGIVAYNLVFLLNLLLCAVSALALVYVLTENKPAAFVAGLVYLTWPFRFSQLDHPNLISTYWLPITLIFLILWLRRRRLRHAILAGIALALVGYTRWQMLIPAGIVIAVYLLATIPTWVRSRRVWAGLLLTAGVAAILLAPPVTLLASEWQDTITSTDDLLFEGEEAVMQTDLLAYVTPGDEHPLWGDFFKPRYDAYYADRSEGRRYPAYIGVLVLALTAAGLWKKRPASYPWLFVALALISLAMGAVLRVAGQLYPQIPTLYQILEPLTIVRLIRVPDRFNITLALPMAVLAGYGVAAVLARLRGPRTHTFITGLISALIFVEYLAIPIPRLATTVSPYYAQMAGETSDSAVLNVPIDLLRAKEYMFAQTTHGKPIVQGKLARIPPGAFDFVDGHPWLRPVHLNSEMPPWLTDVSRQLSSLASNGIETLILHKIAGPERMLHWQRYLAMTPRYEDDDIAVYTTTPRAGIDFSLLEALQPGIGPVQVLLANGCLRPGDVVAADVAWGTSEALTERYVATLTLQNERGEIVEDTALPVGGEWTTEQWPVNTLVWQYLTIETSPSLANGNYDVILSFQQEEQERNAPAMTIGQVTVGDAQCAQDLPPGAVTLDARFGNRLRLLGYTMNRNGNQLNLTLYWRLIQHMDTNYKIFVHVFGADDVPVAQDDAMPHRGGYPTRFWAAGETVVDDMIVDLSKAPPGTYGLAVGVYDPDTAERLPLVDGAGQSPQDNRLVLPEEVAIPAEGE